MSRGLKLGIAAGITGSAALAIGIGKSISAASDLNEEVSKTKQVFGGSAKDILAWSKTSAQSVLLSRTEALSAAGAYGNMFKTIGFGDKQASGMSKRFVQLAGDMASFHNQDPTDMLDRLRSGLSGEAEPLRRFGVLLSENRVKQEAYATGIAKTGAALTEQQKVQARASLIFKDSVKAQGDIQRTGAGFANQQRLMSAQWKDLQTRIGQGFLPVAVKAITFLNKQGPRAFSAIQAGIGPVVEAIGPLADAFQARLPAAIKTLQRTFQPLLSAIGTNLPGAIRGIREAFTPLIQGLTQVIPQALETGRQAFEDVSKSLGGPFKSAVQTIAAVFRALSEAVVAYWGKIIQTLQQNRAKFKNIFDAIGIILKVLIPIVRVVLLNVVVPILRLVFTQLVPRYLAVAIGILNVLAIAIKTTARVVTGFVGGVRSAIKTAGAIIASVRETVTRAFAGAEAWLKNAGRAVIQGFVAGVRAAVALVRAAVAAYKQHVLGPIAGAERWLFDAGRNVIIGFANGLRSMAGTIISAIKEAITDKLPSYVKKALGISSPSKVFAEIGKQLGLGFAQGVLAHREKIKQAVIKTVNAAINAAKSTVEGAAGDLGSALSFAFGQRQAQVRTPAEQQLQALQEARDEASRQKALADAQALQAAAATDEERTAAAQAVADALYDIQVAALEKQAAAERTQLDAQQQIEQQSFDARLQQLNTFLTNGKNTVAQKQAEIGRLMGDFGLSAMPELGPAFAQGLANLQTAVTTATTNLAAEISAGAARIAQAVRRMKAAKADLEAINAEVARRTRRRLRRKGGTATGEGSGAQTLAVGVGAQAAGPGGGLAGPVPVGQNLARTLSRILPSVEAAPAPEFEVRVFIGDQELKGIVRSEVRGQDDLTARRILAQSAGVA